MERGVSDHGTGVSDGDHGNRQGTVGGAAHAERGLSGRIACPTQDGDRPWRYVVLEAGHAAQNVLLQATALGLCAVPVGAFDDEEVRPILGAPSQEQILVLIPVGHPLAD
jgi:nitroreductase